MAEYVRFRFTAAKVGVSMALLALIAGIAEKVQSAPGHAHPVQAARFLKLNGIGGNTKNAFLKIENKLLKIDSAFLKFERSVGANFLKIRDASSFLKITDANAQFLKITDASAQFLKITDASAQFLKIDDANAQFLKIDGTAANAQKVGGIAAAGLVQGKGQVLSNALNLTNGQQQMLLGDGSVRILIALDEAGRTQFTLENDTNASLNFTLIGGSSQSNTIPARGQTNVTPSQPQVDIQMFGGGGGAGKIWTATVSQAGQEFVGQLLIALL